MIALSRTLGELVRRENYRSVILQEVRSRDAGKMEVCVLVVEGKEEPFCRMEEGKIRVEEKPFERYTSVALG